jgi:hypothetical protein
MTTVSAVEQKLTEHQKTGANTYMIPAKNMNDWYKDELLFVRKVENNEVIVFRSMDGKLYSLNDSELINFKLL